MATKINAIPNPAAYSLLSTVGGSDAVYKLRFCWRDRQNAWYVDLYGPDGERVLVGRRLSPRSTPWSNFVIDGLPDALVYCSGPDQYVKTDLGTALNLLCISEAELAEVVAEFDADALAFAT